MNKIASDTEATVAAAELREAFDMLDQGFGICELLLDDDGAPRDYRVLQVNPRFAELTGIEDVAGRRARELDADFDETRLAAVARTALQGEKQRFEIHMKRIDRWLDVYMAPLAAPRHFFFVFTDITAQRTLERDWKAAVETAQRLLAEINHRVMNSLAMIHSVVSFETRRLDPGEGKEALGRVGQRIRALGELYRQLNAGGEDGFVEAGEYLKEVAFGVVAALSDSGRIRVNVDCDTILLDSRQAVPLGLLLNELMTNALKYAFGQEEPGVIELTLKEEGGNCLLHVADNGSGILEPAAGRRAEPDSGGGLGAHLIRSFVIQLGGEIERRTSGGGTIFEVRFPKSAAHP